MTNCDADTFLVYEGLWQWWATWYVQPNLDRPDEVAVSIEASVFTLQFRTTSVYSYPDR